MVCIMHTIFTHTTPKPKLTKFNITKFYFNVDNQILTNLKIILRKMNKFIKGTIIYMTMDSQTEPQLGHLVTHPPNHLETL